MVSKSTDKSPSEQICLACGLCCNGVIFADVKLHAKDDSSRLARLGLGLRAKPGSRKPRFSQPCPALEGCRCTIYAERPHQCRHFECILLKSVQSGRTTVSAALRVIRAALDRAEVVQRLLEELGDSDRHISLGARFRRMAKRVEKTGLDEASAERYGRLTLAVHDLNLLISQCFYS